MPVLFLLFMMVMAQALELPQSCSREQFYDPASLSCLSCPANSSKIRAVDGFSCACEGHSVPTSPSTCKPCNATEVVSSDGASCVPRKCQNTLGRFVCRRCPGDYITVTQNLDGSPTKEVLCIKCSRGYRVQGNTCVRCDDCACGRSEVAVQGTCVPKRFVNARPKYEGTMHPKDLLDVVKLEYLCTKDDFRACRSIANKCVQNFYSADPGGPCQLWLQPKVPAPKGLPPLIIYPPLSTNDKLGPGEMIISRHGKDTISLALAVYTFTGGMKFLQDTKQNSCQLPLNIRIGEPLSLDCQVNLTELLSSDLNETVAPFLLSDGEYKPLPVFIRKPNGDDVQRRTWLSSSFRRYFMVHNSISATSNLTNTIYLRTLLIQLRLERVKHVNGSLRITTTLEVQYAKSMHEDLVTTTLKVEHVMPSAGVIRGLEIWGGVLGAFLTAFALVQWRGAMRRGGHVYSVLPLLAVCVADTLYFSALFSTLHALAAEAGTLGITLPLSRPEERMIKAFLYSAVGLKAIKVVWINWRQCTCDIFFLDWSEYNPSIKETETETSDKRWKAKLLAREWSLLQTKRRASPGYTVTLALVILHLLSPWKALFPKSVIYAWCVATIAWWTSHGVVLSVTWIRQRMLRSHNAAASLQHICSGMGLSLMVFQEEYYAHYVHGRNDDNKEARSLAGPLAMCRVACVPQLREVFRQLSPGMLGDTKQALLSRFLAAFFERALDGLNWVASERTVLERLLDVEINAREVGHTSALLYDDDTTPSCFIMTWWSEEWNLSTFDAMVFSCVFIASRGDALLAALVTLTVWQMMKQIRRVFGDKNQMDKTGVDFYFGT